MSSAYRSGPLRTINDPAPPLRGRTVNTPHRNSNSLINTISRSPIGSMLVQDIYKSALGNIVKNNSGFGPEGIDNSGGPMGPFEFNDVFKGGTKRLPPELKTIFPARTSNNYQSEYNFLDVLGAGGHRGSAKRLAEQEAWDNLNDHFGLDEDIAAEFADDEKWRKIRQSDDLIENLFGALRDNVNSVGNTGPFGHKAALGRMLREQKRARKQSSRLEA